MNWLRRLRERFRRPPQEETTPTSGPVLFYNETLIDHFANPRNIGEMDDGEADGVALVGDPVCGDQMKLWIRLEGNTISGIKFKSFGCPGAIGTSSMATTLAQGKTIEEVLRLTDDDVIEALGGIPEHKRHCSLLGITALHQAVRDHVQTQASQEA